MTTLKSESDAGEPRGLLRTKAVEGEFHHYRLKPSADLAFFIEHFWSVSWRIEGPEPHVAETLPHPSAHVVVEETDSAVKGVTTGKFTRRLFGAGRVFGIKFRPGAFYPFLGAPLSKITDRSLPLREVFGASGDELRNEILAEPDARRCAKIAARFFLDRVPERDSTVERIRDVVEEIAVNREITRVEQVASMLGLSLRPAQRTFRNYVGVTPKWVIQRYRLHEAAEQLAGGRKVDLTDLALRLGYFDQAHFARDFKKVVGRTPGEYSKAPATDT
jgi:AraC-like DNA-binding protein